MPGVSFHSSGIVKTETIAPLHSSRQADEQEALFPRGLGFALRDFLTRFSNSASAFSRDSFSDQPALASRLPNSTSKQSQAPRPGRSIHRASLTAQSSPLKAQSSSTPQNLRGGEPTPVPPSPSWTESSNSMAATAPLAKRIQESPVADERGREVAYVWSMTDPRNLVALGRLCQRPFQQASNVSGRCEFV